MKLFLRIVAIFVVLFMIGIGLIAWIGFKIHQQQQAWGGNWHHPPVVDAQPDRPERPTFEKDDSRAGKVEFSHPRGYQSEPIDLSLSSPEEGSEIWYTMDGSIPIPEHLPGGPQGQRFQESLRIDRTSTVTAVSAKAGGRPSVPVVGTYLFLDDILTQSPESAQEAGWPLRPENGKRMDYGMDPRIVSERPREEWESVFRQIPSLSIVMSLDDLIHHQYGIYANPTGQGKGWERYASIEIVEPDGQDYQSGAGIRIRGGFTRNPQFAKHSFRLFFRKKYGSGKLKYALFGEEGADRFDKIDLRTAQNYAWAREPGRSFGNHNTFVRDVFCRDTQGAMGEPYTRSRYYHLYLNGLYWGIYMTEERPEAAYGATYLGGKRDDYDTLKCSNFLGAYVLEATDGDTEAWRELWEACRSLARDPSDALYQRIGGLNKNFERDPEQRALVEIDNLIHYMLIIFYSGNTDGPLSAFLGNKRSNNWFAIRNRNGKDGFRFFIHDAEHTLGAPESGNDRTGPFQNRNQDRFEYSNPQWIHQDLARHSAYRARFSQLARQQLAEKGALFTEHAIERFRNRARQIDLAIIAQSARWGDAARPQDPYRIEDWRFRIDWVVEDVLRGRSTELQRQLEEDGLF